MMSEVWPVALLRARLQRCQTDTCSVPSSSTAPPKPPLIRQSATSFSASPLLQPLPPPPPPQYEPNPPPPRIRVREHLPMATSGVSRSHTGHLGLVAAYTRRMISPMYLDAQAVVALGLMRRQREALRLRDAPSSSSSSSR